MLIDTRAKSTQTKSTRNLYELGESYLDWFIVPVDLGNGAFGFRALVPQGDIACNAVSSAYPTVQRAIQAGQAFVVRWQQCRSHGHDFTGDDLDDLTEA